MSLGRTSLAILTCLEVVAFVDDLAKAEFQVAKEMITMDVRAKKLTSNDKKITLEGLLCEAKPQIDLSCLSKPR